MAAPTMAAQVPLEGVGTPASVGGYAPEVFIDGNEVPGRAKLRIGNAVLHDGK